MSAINGRAYDLNQHLPRAARPASSRMLPQETTRFPEDREHQRRLLVRELQSKKGMVKRRPHA